MKTISNLAWSLILCLTAWLACGCGAGADDPGTKGNGEQGSGAGAQAGGAATGGSGGSMSFGGSDGGDECIENVDVVFVLDISSSMSFVLDQLHTDIGGVVDAAMALGSAEPHFGLVAFADNELLDGSGTLEGGVVWEQTWGGEGYEQAIAVARRMADLVCDTCLDTDFRVVDAGTHEMNMSVIHGMARIYRKTGNLRAVQLLLGHTKIESTVRYLGVEVDDALAIAEQVDV